MKIGIYNEVRSDERRVALVPGIAEKLKKEKAEVLIPAGAGKAAHYNDAAYLNVGATIVEEPDELDVLFRICPPTVAEVSGLKKGSTLVGFLNPMGEREVIEALCEHGISSFAFELMPRSSRAQAMDALSSQRSIAGYRAVLEGANLLGKFLPMLTTPAGTIKPAQVLIIGVGVAGLQAIATARRLGAVVEAQDVRPESREQVESLGAKFISPGLEAGGSGGYARELTATEKGKQEELLAKHIAKADIVITTAAIPNRKSPVIVQTAMVEMMRAGSVIVDGAAEGGGNCELSQPGKTISHSNGVTIHAPLNLPARAATHASDMLARNFYNMARLFMSEGEVRHDWEDDILAGSCLTHDGKVVHPQVREFMAGGAA